MEEPKPLISRATTVKELEEAIELGDNINARNGYYRETPLIIASRKGDIEMLDWLLQHGADTNSEDRYSNTALMSACREGHTHIVRRFLQEKDIDPNRTTDSSSALVVASAQGNVDIVEMLAEHGTDLNVVTNEGTALTKAIEEEKIDVIDLLLRKGANVNVTDFYDRTALHAAASIGRLDFIDRLIFHGVNPNPPGTEQSPLMMACSQGFVEIAKRLIMIGADVNFFVIEGWTALREACANNNVELVRVLLAANADPKARDDRGMTAFDFADSEEIKQLLLFYQ